jgi:hypothetical protein
MENNPYIIEKILKYCDEDLLILLQSIIPKVAKKEIGNRIGLKIAWKHQLNKHILDEREYYWDTYFENFEFRYTFFTNSQKFLYEHAFYPTEEDSKKKRQSQPYQIGSYIVMKCDGNYLTGYFDDSYHKLIRS